MKCRLENGCSWDKTEKRCCKDCKCKCNKSCNWWDCTNESRGQVTARRWNGTRKGSNRDISILQLTQMLGFT